MKTSGGTEYKEVISVISRSPRDRPREGLIVVREWLKSCSTLFAGMNGDILLEVAKNCTCQIMRKDSMVVKQGDRGNSFYIILHGDVSIYVKEVTERTDIFEDVKATYKQDQKMPKSKLARILPKLKAQREPQTAQRDQLGMKVATISDGKSFGELALQSADNFRAASCVTDSTTAFLVVGRDLYNKSIREYQTRELEKSHNFVEGHPYFSAWNARLQIQTQQSLLKVLYRTGEKVVTQGESCDGIHFMVNGQVKLVFNSQKHVYQYDQEESTFEEEETGVHERIKRLSRELVQIKRVEGYAAAELYQQSKHQELCLVTQNEQLGDVEQMLGWSTYIGTAEAVGDVEVYHLTKENLKRLLDLASRQGKSLLSGTLLEMRTHALSKWLSRMENFPSKCDRIPLIGRLVERLTKLIEEAETQRETGKRRGHRTLDEKLFQSLVKAYLSDRAPLIVPAVEGGHYFRMKIQSRARQRRLQAEREARGSVFKTPRALRPIKFMRQPRSIAILKEEIKKQQTSDVDVIIPRREPIPPIKRAAKKTDLKTSEIDTDTAEKENVVTNKDDTSQINVTTDDSTSQKDIHENERSTKTVQISTENQFIEHQSISLITEISSLSDSPVKVTEQKELKTKPLSAAPRCDHHNVNLVAGQTLQFYSQYLRGRLEKQYEQAEVNPAIVDANATMDQLEQKIYSFYDPNNNLPQNTNLIARLARIDETREKTILPGGKCYIQRSPCRLLKRSMQLKNHSHIRHHMVEQ